MHGITTSASLLALLGYASWTLALLVLIAVHRAALVVGGRRPNSFSPWGADVSPFSERLCRAHANCIENLPVFAGFVVVATLAGARHVTDPLALWVLAARIAQSTVHLLSTTNRAVMLRFALLAGQVLVMMTWLLEFAFW